MKHIKYIFIIIILITNNCYSQYECNTGINTELRSSSNGRPGSYLWKGWACGINGTVIRCDNPPYSAWIKVSGNGIPSNVTLDNICGLDGVNAFVCGHLDSNTWIWKTTNGGSNWVQVFNQPNGMINAVYMKNYLKGIIIGNPVNGRWSIWKTNNGGSSWDSSGSYLPQSGNESGFSNSLCIGEYSGDTNKIWFGTNNSKVYYSSDYGQSWSAQSTAPEQNPQIISYINYFAPVTVYIGGSNYLLKSTNFGTNWVQDTVGGSGKITGIAGMAWSIMLTRENKLYNKNYWNGGWNLWWTAPTGTYNYIDNRYGGGNWSDHYAVKTNGGITFCTQGEGINKISDNIPNGFILSQNYPNPFNPTTSIKFSVPQKSFVTITIYNVLGEEITKLVSEGFSPGTYETNWDASNYPSGVYYYKLEAINPSATLWAGYTETKKMVLIK